jgi:hypothetical protein
MTGPGEGPVHEEGVAVAGFARRMLRAALLEAQAYEEVEADLHATKQAVLVVVLASVAAGIGSLDNNGWTGIPIITGVALVGWWLWAAITLFVGTKLLPRPDTVSDMGELLRTIGFASAPGLLFCLAIFDPIDWLVFPLVGLWMLVSMVVAVRQALDYEGPGGTLRAIAVCAIGFPAYWLLITLAMLALGPWPL